MLASHASACWALYTLIDDKCFIMFPRRHVQKLKVVCTAASPSGSSSPDGDSNPYEVLGVSPIEGFDMIKTAYSRKRKEAERRGDEAIANRVSLKRHPSMLTSSQLYPGDQGLPSPVNKTCALTWESLLYL
ncbi:hypothetical protein IFM89_017992 [Coptis chinensis]|uniref:Uncharacterized protein n=1 Tax=Coptis chinensis TaxID=261450 RepID=A0A835LWC5_9MAGN|nr:hypothetical protein IFM89_017992 [Coptis chinensis]